MRVSVLAVLPRQEPLMESAIAARDGRSPNIPISAAAAPGGMEIDPAFSAVPIGDATSAAGMLEMAAETSEKFVVRGYMEAESLDAIPETVDGREIYADPQIAPFLTCGGSPPVNNHALVRSKLKVPTLAARGLDGAGVAVAIMDTGINLAHLNAPNRLPTPAQVDVANSWTAPGVGTTAGAHAVGHGTMCAYDVLLAAPKARLLDYSILRPLTPGTPFVGQSLSVAVQAYGNLLAFWAVAGQTLYKALVVNNSWGIFHTSWDFPVGHPGRYVDNPNHPFSLLVGVLAGSGADILFAAGNCGSQCPDGRCMGVSTHSIMGANASPAVLTLAGCDTTDQRVGYSSQGPAMPSFPPEKPDLTAYTHFLGSQAFGTNAPDSGTSAACPVAAGCVAAIRTKVSPRGAGSTSPAALFDILRQKARRVPGQTGWNADFGHGIIDPDAAAIQLGV